MKPEVAAHFRSNPPPAPVKQYLTDVTAQQCSISKIYWRTDCPDRPLVQKTKITKR